MAHPVVRKLECFGSLSEDDKEVLLRLVAAEREVPAREDLIQEGDDPTVVHLVTSGFACRYKRLEGGQRQIVAFLVAGDLCDPYAFILKEMDHSIATIVPSRVVSVARHEILDLLARPALARCLFMAALVDAATLREWIATIGQRSAEQRIAHLFCELHARLRAVGKTSAGVAELPLNQQDLSDAVGLSLVHTNRSLKSLKSQNLVSLQSGKLVILDANGLEAMCGFKPNYLHLAPAERNRTERTGSARQAVAGSSAGADSVDPSAARSRLRFASGPCHGPSI